MQSFQDILLSAYDYINNISNFAGYTDGLSFVAVIPHLSSVTSWSVMGNFINQCKPMMWQIKIQLINWLTNSCL